MLAASFPTVIMIHPSVPAENAKEFVALAKSQPASSPIRRPAPATART